ncbi:MAG: phosphoglycerate kinase [Chlamydiales bacterium]|nr:phosphoglycerate kinase [Chlamydiales bacterium]
MHSQQNKKLTLKDLQLAHKRVFVRVDFNVPLDKAGNITDDSRIVASLPTIQYLIGQKAKVILASHLGRPKGKSADLSLAICAKRLRELLNQPVTMAPDSIGDDVTKLVDQMNPGDVVLLENLRFYPAEEAPEIDPSFAKKLAALADVYINDAFGTAHRAHSSTATIAQYFPGQKAAGFLLEKEIAFLGDALQNPKCPFVAIIGGAKISTKIGVLKALSQKVDILMIGGGMAYTFLKAQGISIGNSIVEDSMLNTAQEILNGKAKIYLPKDIVAAIQFSNDSPFKTFSMTEGIPDGYQGMDIGPTTLGEWIAALQPAKTILWNGPVGVFEIPNFAKGTNTLAQAIANLKDATTIVGGGDSVAAVQNAGLTHAFTHVSTGGGASLEYVEYGTLPGIQSLS